MADLHILTDYNEIFQSLEQALTNYNENLFNDLFMVIGDEFTEENLKRGEKVYDQIDANVNNLQKILLKQQEIDELFRKCKENKQRCEDYKNDIINRILRIKKRISSRNDYLNAREEWNQRRIETSDQKNRRECEEMMEDMIEEKQIIQQMRNELNKERELFNQEIQQSINERNNNQYVHQNEYNTLINSYNQLIKQHNEIYSNYVRKDEIQRTLSDEMKWKQNILTRTEIEQMQKWTNKTMGDVIFDSRIDKWGLNDSVLNRKIEGKGNLIFLIEDNNGEKFGYYLNTQIEQPIQRYEWWMKTDNNSFHFNLGSNGRIAHPIKYPIKDTLYGSYQLYKTRQSDRLIWLGDIQLKKYNKGYSSYQQNMGRFDYLGIQNALCVGETDQYGSVKFIPKTILVIQME